MNLQKKKAQAALEFLVTYGWAFLVVLVAISALASYGYFDPKKYFPERCDFEKVECFDHQITHEDNTVMFILENDLTTDIKIKEVNISTDSVSPLECVLQNQAQIKGEVWNSSLPKEFIFQDCNLEEVGITDNTKARFEIDIKFHAKESSPDYTHHLRGVLLINT